MTADPLAPPDRPERRPELLTSSVLQSWVGLLPWKQQSILLSGLRGPDHPTCPAIKRVCRWLRRVSQHNADPSKDYMKVTPNPSREEVCDELEYLPCHFVHHFADALRVVGLNHPNNDVRAYANTVHEFVAEEIFHFVAEAPDTFVERHRDKLDVAVPARAHQPETEEEKDVMARSATREIRDRQPAAVTDGGEQDDSAGGVTMDDVNRINHWLNTCADRATSVEERLSIGRLMNKVHILWERGSYGVRKRG